jgi:hypothetical protein
LSRVELRMGARTAPSRRAALLLILLLPQFVWSSRLRLRALLALPMRCLRRLRRLQFLFVRGSQRRLRAPFPFLLRRPLSLLRCPAPSPSVVLVASPPVPSHPRRLAAAAAAAPARRRRWEGAASPVPCSSAAVSLRGGRIKKQGRKGTEARSSTKQ